MKKVKDENIKKVEEVKKDTKKDEVIKKETKKAQLDLFLGYMPYIIIILFVVIIRLFIATPVRVNGSSMSPTLKNGDTMILYKLTKKIRGIKRFDIVVVQTDSGKLIKRVIGLPGDKIEYKIEKDKEDNEIGVLYINGKKTEETFLSDEAKVNTCAEDWYICGEEVTIPDGEYFVMGDNRINSKDSRMIGTVEDSDILGTTEIIIWPLGRIGKAE